MLAPISIEFKLEMEKHFDTCLLCNHNLLKDVYPNEHPYLVRCTNCEFVFFKKIPTLNELIKNYNNYPRHDSISPLTIKRYHEILSSFEKYRKTGKVIDVGCGNGHLLQQAKLFKWDVHGTEFTDNAVEYCIEKGIKMEKGVLNINNYEASSFDCVFFIEVIEHINNPIEEIRKFETLLRKGGVLYITTPNFISFSSRYLKSKWGSVEFPEHLCYYSPKTLNKLLVEHGFKKVSLKTTGVGISSIKPKSEISGSIAQHNDVIRQKTEKNLILSTAKYIVNFGLNIFRLGDTIKAIYIKN